jgi:hypothetical protein
VPYHLFGILAMCSAATTREKIWDGALQRYVGSGRVHTKTVGQAPKGALGFLI